MTDDDQTATSNRWPDRATRRAQILDAARAVFIESGYAGARTQRIAQQAGVTEPVVYKHFESKDQLFQAAVLEPLETMIGDLVDQTHDLITHDEPAERRRRFVAMHELVSRTCTQIVPLLGIALFTEGGPEFYRDRLTPALERAYAITDQLLASWPTHQQLDGHTAFTMTLGMHLGLALDAHMRGTDLDTERTAASLAHIVVRGLSE